MNVPCVFSWKSLHWKSLGPKSRRYSVRINHVKNLSVQCVPCLVGPVNPAVAVHALPGRVQLFYFIAFLQELFADSLH